MQLEIDIKDNGLVKSVILNGERGIKIQKSKVCRQVFIFKHHVVKFNENPLDDFCIEVDSDCVNQTTKEIEFIKTIAPRDKKYFCLPLEIGKVKGFNYIVQDRIKQTGKFTPEKLKTLYRICDKYGLEDIHFSEKKPINFYFTDDSFVIYDYAVFRRHKFW